MRVLGIVLVLAGILAVTYGGITYTKREKVLDLGSVQATVDKKERIPLSPVAGGLALAAGIVLLLSHERSLRPRRS
jgi:hypothetical protein